MFPDMQFCFYEEGVIFDHQKNKQFYFHSDRTRDRQSEVEQLSMKPYAMGDFTISKVKTTVQRKKFEDSVRKAKHHIREGDIFQVVLSKRFDFDFKGDSSNILILSFQNSTHLHTCISWILGKQISSAPVRKCSCVSRMESLKHSRLQARDQEPTTSYRTRD